MIQKLVRQLAHSTPIDIHICSILLVELCRTMEKQIFCGELLENFLPLSTSLRTYGNFKKVLTLEKNIKSFDKYYPAAILLSFSARNSISWKMSKTVVCHISIALNIKFSSERGPRDTKNWLHCDSWGIWSELWSEKCFPRQSLTKYAETNLRNQVK